MERVKKYKGSDGEYLELVEQKYGYRISWWFPIDGEGEGGAIGDVYPGPTESAPDDPDLWSDWCAYYACLPFSEQADCKSWEGPLTFETARRAKDAIRAANFALTTKSRPWPEWALKARDAGWTAPEGWKP